MSLLKFMTLYQEQDYGECISAFSDCFNVSIFSFAGCVEFLNWFPGVFQKELLPL